MQIVVEKYAKPCWKCGEQVTVVTPDGYMLSDDRIGAAIADQGYGNLERVYSNTRGREVWGNVCPSCGTYQGNHYVDIVEYADAMGEGRIEKVGVIDITFTCKECGKKITEEYARLCAECGWEKRQEAARERQRKLEEEGKECPLCGELFFRLTAHHISYYPEETIEVCTSCHNRIHYEEGFHNELEPDEKRPSGYGTWKDARERNPPEKRLDEFHDKDGEST